MSTPIETNTEELQEILQTVYNLPMAGGGGSAKPDLTIGFSDPNFEGAENLEKYTYDPAEVVATYNKLLTGQTVNCVMNAVYCPDSGGTVHASSPQVTAYAKSDPYNSSIVGYMAVYFKFWRHYSGYNGHWNFIVYFDILGNGTAEIAQGVFINDTGNFGSAQY